MTGKTTDNKHWTDPKDYGLPYVEVVPLAQARISKKEEGKAAPINVAEVKKKTIQALKPPLSEIEQVSKSEFKIEEKKSSSSWIWIAAILALTVVVVIIWQMNKSDVSTQGSEVYTSESAEGAASKENDEAILNSTPSEEFQDIDNQVINSDSLSSAKPAIQSGQTGTTIDDNATGNLVKVTEKSSRPQFYIIVGSLPNEELAVKEASQYFNRTETIYLIMPYEGSDNYRLAIERSIGFTAMTEELERVKDQYSEALWILKY